MRARSGRLWAAAAAACASCAAPPSVRLAVKLLLPDSPKPAEVASLALHVLWNGGDAGLVVPGGPGDAGALELPLPAGPVVIEVDGLDSTGAPRWRGYARGVELPADADGGAAVATVFFGKIGAFSTFQATPPMPPLAGSAAVAWGEGRLLVLGGRAADGGVTDGVWLYDQRTVELTPEPPLRHARAHAFAAVGADLGGSPYVLLAGGEGGDGAATDSVEIYRPEGGLDLPPLGAPQIDPSGAPLDEAGLEIAVGCGAPGFAALDVYAPGMALAGGDGGLAAELPLPSACPNGALQHVPGLGLLAGALGGEIWLLSPLSGGSPFASTELPRGRFAVAPLDGGWLQLGGEAPDGGVLATAELDLSGRPASVVPLLATPRAAFATLAVADGGLLAVGGLGAGGVALSSAERVDLSSLAATAAGALGSGRIRPALADVPGYRAALVVSGEDPTGAPVGGLEIYSYP